MGRSEERTVRLVDIAREITTDGGVSFQLQVARAGKYLFKGRAFADSQGSDSFYVSANGGERTQWTVWDAGQRFRWHWSTLTGAAGKPVVLDLKGGLNSLTVTRREDGARMDKIVVIRLEAKAKVDPGEL